MHASIAQTSGTTSCTYKSGQSTCTNSADFTCTASYGTGSYSSYTWTKVSGYGTLGTITGNVCNVYYTGNATKDGQTCVISCKVVDSGGNTITVNYTITWSFSSNA